MRAQVENYRRLVRFENEVEHRWYFLRRWIGRESGEQMGGNAVEQDP